MKKLITTCLTILAVCGLSSLASATTITFDEVSAPTYFMDTTHLSELYAPMGVHFSGPGDLDGGAIINAVAGSWSIWPVSGLNFLAFHRDYHAYFTDGGHPLDAETILFDDLMSDVSIYAAGTYGAGNFLMQAYDAAGNLVDSDTVNTAYWQQMTVSYAQGIKKVVLTETTDKMYFAYDDLSFNAIPEPTTICLLGIGALSLIRRKK